MADTNNADIVYVSGSKPRKRFVGPKKSSNTTTGKKFYSCFTQHSTTVIDLAIHVLNDDYYLPSSFSGYKLSA